MDVCWGLIDMADRTRRRGIGRTDEQGAKQGSRLPSQRLHESPNPTKPLLPTAAARSGAATTRNPRGTPAPAAIPRMRMRMSMSIRRMRTREHIMRKQPHLHQLIRPRALALLLAVGPLRDDVR